MSAVAFIRIILIDLQGHTLARYRPMFMLIEMLLFFIAGVFWIVTDKSPETFSPATWGWFAYSFPAQMWASMLMVASFTTFWGLVRPPARGMIILGLLLHVTNYSALAYSAFMTSGDMAVSLYACFFAAIHALLGTLIIRRGDRYDIDN